jgi:hypothetical protein
MVNRKKLATHARTPSPQMTVYAIIQTITGVLCSWWEHTKLQISIFREHVNFVAGFKEKIIVITTRPVSRFKYLNSIQISNKHKKKPCLKITSV